MITYKIIGAVFILTASVFASHITVKREKERVGRLRLFSDLAEQIRMRIENFSQPLSEILRYSDNPLVKHAFSKDNDLPLNLETVILNEEKSLEKGEREILLEFSSSIGRSYREDEIKLCRYYSEILEELCAEKEKDYFKKRKLTYTLGICFALAVIILMI